MTYPTRKEYTARGRATRLRVATLGAPNPSGTGQPNQECEDVQPPGFGNGGFGNAESHYAGSSGTPSEANAGCPHVVSQYEVACYQQVANSH
jgi:hypothetical protein